VEEGLNCGLAQRVGCAHAGEFETSAVRERAGGRTNERSRDGASSVRQRVRKVRLAEVQHASAPRRVRGIELVEEERPAFEPGLVGAVVGGDARQHAFDARRLIAAELCILEIDVVHDLGDRPQRRIADRKAAEQGLEGAPVAVVGELSLEHVEPEVAGRGVVRGRIDELEAGVAIDEPADEPGAGDAVDEDAGARDPGAPANAPALRSA